MKDYRSKIVLGTIIGLLSFGIVGGLFWLLELLVSVWVRFPFLTAAVSVIILDAIVMTAYFLRKTSLKNEAEAMQLVAKEMEKLRELSYSDLKSFMDQGSKWREVYGLSSGPYLLSIESFWYGDAKTDVRVVVSVSEDRPRLRLAGFRSVAEDLIVKSSGKVVNE